MQLEHHAAEPRRHRLQPFIKPAQENRLAADVGSRIAIKWSSPAALAASLSGGNQQKLLIARWPLANSEFLIFDEPTRGIDVGAKTEVYGLLNRLAEEGKAILFISSELPELFGIADRLLVMRRGKLVGDLVTKQTTPEQVDAPGRRGRRGDAWVARTRGKDMNKFARQLLPFGTLTLIIATLSALEPDTFLMRQNFSNVLSRSSYSGIIAMGMTAVIISGGIDLSVGSMMALCGMIAGLIMTLHGEVVPTPGLMVLGTLAGVVMGLVCGSAQRHPDHPAEPAPLHRHARHDESPFAASPT